MSILIQLPTTMAAFSIMVIGCSNMCTKICRSQGELNERLDNLKLTACPHCKIVGTLNRHGFLRGYEQGNFRKTVIRAQRVFCSNRNRSGGCGRTFSVWTADKVKRLFLSADQLWQFLKNAASTSNKRQALAKLDCDMSDSAPYRIWKRFLKAQTDIRTALSAVCPPPKNTGNDNSHHPAQSTIAHLAEAFAGNELNPIAAFQSKLQTFFI